MSNVNSFVRDVTERMVRLNADGANITAANNELRMAEDAIKDQKEPKANFHLYMAKTAMDKAEAVLNLNRATDYVTGTPSIPSAAKFQAAIDAARSVIAAPNPTSKDREEQRLLNRQRAEQIRSLNSQVRERLLPQIQSEIEIVETGQRIEEIVDFVRTAVESNEKTAKRFGVRFASLTTPVTGIKNLAIMRQQLKGLETLKIEIELLESGIDLQLTGTLADLNLGDDVKDGSRRHGPSAERLAKRAAKREQDRKDRTARKGGSGGGKKKGNNKAA